MTRTSAETGAVGTEPHSGVVDPHPLQARDEGELLPCPFCATAPAMDSEPGQTFIWCANDQCIIFTHSPAPYNDSGHRASAITAWNTRTPRHNKEGGPTEAETLAYAQQVATYAAKRAGCIPEWRPLGDVYGCLTQIDNSLTGLTARTQTNGGSGSPLSQR